MKKIKVNIAGLSTNDPTSYGNYFLRVLRKKYDVEISDKPDYLIYNEASNEYLNHDCIRIFYTAENIHPNFNFCDYALSFDYMNFGDRHFRLPFYLLMQFVRPNEIDSQQKENLDFRKQVHFTVEDLRSKTEFCSFVYSNYLGDPARETFFNLLQKYKKVNSGGKYLNNVGGPVPHKLEFEKNHKFSIAFENSSRSGYTTEKLTNAILAQTIPIYWGNPDIGKEFNTERFINCHDYPDFDAVIERVKEIDADDELYLKIMNTPFTIPEFDTKEVENECERFIYNIIDQPLSEARRRRINQARARVMEQEMKLLSKIQNMKKNGISLLAKLYHPVKNIKGMEQLKRKIKNLKK